LACQLLSIILEDILKGLPVEVVQDVAHTDLTDLHSLEVGR